MRKKKPPEHVNHERWLISYADFITLLFAFFVVMFAVSQVDAKKMGRFTEAFSKAVGINVLPQQGESILSGGQTPDDTGTGEESTIKDLEGLKAALDNLARGADALQLQGLQVFRRRNELVLRLPEALLFDTGEARIKDGSLGTIKIIAPQLRDRNVEIRVEGHTDNRPIASGRFRSNWELSTARGIAVMIILAGEGILESRLSVGGYAEFRPVAPNTTDDGRKQNRRVDLVVTVLAPSDEGSTQ
jgi:chemotaxis protein MotB